MEDKDKEGVIQLYQKILNEEEVALTSTVDSWEEWDNLYLQHSRFIMENAQNELIGWAALSNVSAMPCFAGVAETNIYVDKAYRKKGLGTMLLKKMVVNSENQGIWTLQSQIFETNQASIALHKRLGFRIVGVRYNLAKIGNKLKNITLMERHYN